MSEKNSKPKKLSLSGSGKLTLGGGGLDQTTLRSGVAASRGKNVQVEVRRKRVLNPALRASPSTQPETLVPKEGTVETSVQIDDRLTAAERANRIKVLQEGLSKTQTAPAVSSQSENNDEEKEYSNFDFTQCDN
ncbi:MAG: translation initiation factor IF-2 associated domain-containing protein, partial [Candidatus Puniceispirillaceae bacterium]